MSILTKTPPIELAVGGEVVPICADFRTILRIDALRDSETPDMDSGLQALLLFYGGKIPNDMSDATDKMLWFIKCGGVQSNGNARGKPAQPDFSFEHDAPLIYAAFMDQYGIDLVHIDFLHWWEFRALMDGLREEHRFCEIRRCRSIDLGTIKDKDRRRYYSDMKKIYALPLPEADQAQLDALTAALMGDGDVWKALAEK